MIVLGAGTHKRSHTIAAIAAATGELLGEQTVPVGRRGCGALLQWARGLDGERVWAVEDCRHVSGSLERFLIERGECVLRIPTHLTANARRSARRRGKSDAIDARSTSLAPRCGKAWTASRPRTWPGPSATCGCWSTTASGWCVTASSSTARCSGICTICGPSCSQRTAARFGFMLGSAARMIRKRTWTLIGPRRPLPKR